MPRSPRYVLPEVPQHVIQRGNNRQPVFFHADEYRLYLACLQAAAVAHGRAVHAYVLMTNHVHLLLRPRQPNSIAKIMQALGRRYVQYINTTYQRTGTLWEGRYRASLVEAASSLLACYRSSELNPVRAGMVPCPEEYPWSRIMPSLSPWAARPASDTLPIETCATSSWTHRHCRRFARPCTRVVSWAQNASRTTLRPPWHGVYGCGKLGDRGKPHALKTTRTLLSPH